MSEDSTAELGDPVPEDHIDPLGSISAEADSEGQGWVEVPFWDMTRDHVSHNNCKWDWPHFSIEEVEVHNCHCYEEGTDHLIKSDEELVCK